MPRTYIPKLNSKRIRQYSEDYLEKGLTLYLDDKMSMNKVCKLYKIPKGTFVNRVHGRVHGWFDTSTFIDWFKCTFLPHALLLPGTKALIGDNLSSHFTPEVLKLCCDNNILFICLPANATHLAQPLDVSFFGPLKKTWRSLLTDWKKKNPKSSAVEKSLFPKLLRQLFDNLPNMEKNIVSGFRATGIYPLAAEQLLKRLPRRKNDSTDSGAATSQADIGASNISESVIEFLSAQRNPQSSGGSSTTKKKKLSVIAGRSVAAEDTPQKVTNKNQRACENRVEVLRPKKSCKTSLVFTDTGTSHSDHRPGDLILVEYARKKEKRTYLGEVVSREEDDFNVKFLRSVDVGKTVFRFKDGDEDIIASSNILNKQLPSYKLNNRRHYVFDESVSAE